QLYAGGTFGTMGGTLASAIAKWDGSTWSALGSGISGRVIALAVSGSNVYAGGDFLSAGGNLANNIAKWDGSGWSALGSGADNLVYALSASDQDLYVGGRFFMAGDKVSHYVARARIGEVSPGRFANVIYSSGNGFSCTFLDATSGQHYR